MSKCSSERMRPLVGIGVIVIKEGRILLGERINAHGAGTWSPPGGHLEYGESPQECAVRELDEEAGLNAEEVIPGPWTNDFFDTENKHYVTLYMIVPHFKGVLSVREPERCLGWGWFEFDRLPSPLFPTFSNLLRGITLNQLLVNYFPSTGKRS